MLWSMMLVSGLGRFVTCRSEAAAIDALGIERLQPLLSSFATRSGARGAREPVPEVPLR